MGEGNFILRSNSRSLGNHVVNPGEEKGRLQWEEFAEKESFKPQNLHPLTDQPKNLVRVITSATASKHTQKFCVVFKNQ